jgi:phage terminase large subunit
MPTASTRLTDPDFRGSISDIQIASHPEIILTGPTRTGKTLGVLWKAWKQIEKYDGARALLIRKRRTDLSETALVTLERDVIGKGTPLVIDGPSRDYRKNYQLENNSIMVVGGLDNPGKILSSEFDIIVVPQAEELTPTDWETLITRLSGTATPPHLQQIVGDCNPTSPQHWIMQRSLDGNLKLWDTFHKDNPLLWDGEDWTEFGKTYLDRLTASLTGTERQRLLEGKWVQAEGVVYREFTTENIVDTEPNPDLPIELACDDGYVDPRAILFIQRTGTEILVFDEIYHSRHLAETCVSEVVERCEQNGWPLPQIAAGGAESKELKYRFRKANIPYRAKPHKVVEGIKEVRRQILDGQGVRSLLVNRRCKNLITEITDSFRYPAQGGRRDDEKPLDGNDHACEALRYWVHLRAPN